jgi:hypothetical protein
VNVGLVLHTEQTDIIVRSGINLLWILRIDTFDSHIDVGLA